MTENERKRFILSKRYALAKAGGKVDRLRASMIEEKIREKYSVSDELAILRQRDTKPHEFDEYNDFVEQIKYEVQCVIDEFMYGR